MFRVFIMWSVFRFNLIKLLVILMWFVVRYFFFVYRGKMGFKEGNVEE